MATKELLTIKEEFQKYYKETKDKNMIFAFNFESTDDKDQRIDNSLKIIRKFDVLGNASLESLKNKFDSETKQIMGYDTFEYKDSFDKQILSKLYDENIKLFDAVESKQTFKSGLELFFDINNIFKENTEEEKKEILTLLNESYEQYISLNPNSKGNLSIEEIRSVINNVGEEIVNFNFEKRKAYKTEVKFNDIKDKLHEKAAQNILGEIRKTDRILEKVFYEEIYDLHQTFLDFNEYLYYNNLIDAGIKNEFHSRMIQVDSIKDPKQYEINESMKKVMFSDMSFNDIGKYMSESDPFKSPILYSALWQEHKDKFYESKGLDYKQLPKYTDIEKVDNLPKMDKIFESLNQDLEQKNFISNKTFLKDTNEVLETLDKSYNINYEDIPVDALANFKDYLNFMKITEEGVINLPDGMINKKDATGSVFNKNIPLFENECSPELQRNIVFVKIMKNEIDQDSKLYSELTEAIKTKEGFYSVSEYKKANETEKDKIKEDSKAKISNETELSKANFKEKIENILIQSSDNLFTEKDKQNIKKLLDENNFEKLDEALKMSKKLFDIKKTFVESSNIKINNALTNKSLSGDGKPLLLDDNLEAISKNNKFDHEKARATFMKHMKTDIKEWMNKPDGIEGFLYRFGSIKGSGNEKLGLTDLMMPTYIIKDMFALFGQFVSLAGLTLKIMKEEEQNRNTLAKLSEIQKIKEKFGESSSEFKEEAKYAMDILKKSKHSKDFENIDLNKEINGSQISYAISKLEEVSRKNMTDINKIMEEISQYDIEGLGRTLDKTNTKDIFLSSMRIYNNVLEDKQEKINAKDFNDYNNGTKPIINREAFNKIIYNFRNDEKLFPELIIMLKEANQLDDFFDFLNTSKMVNPHSSKLLLDKLYDSNNSASLNIVKDFITDGQNKLTSKLNNNNELLNRIFSKKSTELSEIEKVNALDEIRNCVGNDILTDIIKDSKTLSKNSLAVDNVDELKQLIEIFSELKKDNKNSDYINNEINKIKSLIEGGFEVQIGTLFNDLIDKKIDINSKETKLIFDELNKKLEDKNSDFQMAKNTKSLSISLELDENPLSKKILGEQDYNRKFTPETSLHDFVNNMYSKTYKLNSKNELEIVNSKDLFSEFRLMITENKWQDKYNDANYYLFNSNKDKMVSLKSSIESLVASDLDFKNEFGSLNLTEAELKTIGGSKNNILKLENFVENIPWDLKSIEAIKKEIKIEIKDGNYNDDQMKYLKSLLYAIEYKDQVNKMSSANQNKETMTHESIVSRVLKNTGIGFVASNQLDQITQNIHEEKTKYINEIKNAPEEVKKLEKEKSELMLERDKFEKNLIIVKKANIPSEQTENTKIHIEHINRVIDSDTTNKLKIKLLTNLEEILEKNINENMKLLEIISEKKVEIKKNEDILNNIKNIDEKVSEIEIKLQDKKIYKAKEQKQKEEQEQEQENDRSR